MIDFLTLVIIGVALFQPTSERRIIALIFAAFTFAHNIFLHDLDGFMYFSTDALFYLMVIMIVGSIDRPPKLAINIQKISLAAIALDYFGWLAWSLYIPSTGYNMAFMLLYAWTIIILLKGDRANDGSNAMDSGITSIRPHAHSGYIINNRHSET